VNNKKLFRLSHITDELLKDPEFSKLLPYHQIIKILTTYEERYEKPGEDKIKIILTIIGLIILFFIAYFGGAWVLMSLFPNIINRGITGIDFIDMAIYFFTGLIIASIPLTVIKIIFDKKSKAYINKTGDTIRSIRQR